MTGVVLAVQTDNLEVVEDERVAGGTHAEADAGAAEVDGEAELLGPRAVEVGHGDDLHDGQCQDILLRPIIHRKQAHLILDVLGQGTFGQVVKCQNMKTHEVVAVKVVKNKPAYFNQSMMEVTILELVRPAQWRTLELS